MATDKIGGESVVQVTGIGVVTCTSEVGVSCTNVGVVTEKVHVPRQDVG